MGSPHPRAELFRAVLDIETLGDLALRLGTARLALGTGDTWERGVPGAWLAASSLLPYWAHRHAPASSLPVDDPASVPTAIDIFGGEFVPFPKPPRELAGRYFRVAAWAEHDRGGHFPAIAAPGLLAGRLREVFRSCREP